MDPSSSDRVQNTLSQNSAPVAASTDGNQGGTAERTYAGVNSVSYLQGSNHSSGSSSSAIYLDAFPGGERSGNRGVSPCEQPKGPEQVPPQGEIQDGGTPHCSPPTPQRRLHDETRPEGRLLRCIDTSGLQEISSLSVRRNNIRVPLPFVWSVAAPPPPPRVFTRISRPVVAKLRSEGVRTVIYLDDLLLIHHQKETLIEIFYYVQKLLSSLGFVVKREKCSPAPTRQLVFLGAVLDTNQMSLALPGEQIDRIQTVCQQILETGSATLGELASLLGRMSHAARTGLWEAPFHYRALQRQQASLLHRVGWRPKTPKSLNPPSLEDRAWWLSLTLHSHNRQDITPLPFDLTIRTDASLRGWGATCRGSTTGGRWSMEEQGQHINYLELKAAFRTLKSFLGQGAPAPTRCWDQHPPRHILLEMDNTTAVAVAVVNRRGGTQSPTLSLLALDLWSFLLERGLWVRARHLPSPGVLNVEAHAASRVFNVRTEWMLRKDVFRHIMRRFYLPQIDLFASRLSHQVPLYVSLLPDPGASAVDAFLLDWSQWKSFIHPPVVPLPRILQKVTDDKASALLVAPDWPGQPWYAQIQLTLMGAPYRLPKEKTLLSLPFDREAIHPLWRSLNLTVWPISGKPTRQPVSPRK